MCCDVISPYLDVNEGWVNAQGRARGMSPSCWELWCKGFGIRALHSVFWQYFFFSFSFPKNREQLISVLVLTSVLVSSSWAAFVFLVSSPQAALTVARALEQLPRGCQSACWQPREASQVCEVPGRKKALWSPWLLFCGALERIAGWRLCSKMIYFFKDYTVAHLQDHKVTFHELDEFSV